MPQEPKDDKEVLDSSPETPDDKGSTPSTEQHDDKGPQSLAEAVKAAAEDGGVEEPSPEPPKPEGEEPAKETKQDDDKKEPVEPEPSKEDKKDVPPVDTLDTLSEKFKNNPGVQNLIKEYREAKPTLEWAGTLNKFISDNRINQETFNSAMNIAALLVNNPSEALKQLEPIVQRLKDVNGDGALPADLQQEVAEGKITEDAARRIMRAEAAVKVRTQTAAQQQQEAFHRANQSALDGWEQNQRQRDPAFDKKFPVIKSKLVEILTFTPAKSPADLVRYAEQAYAFANETIGSFVPKPPARKVFRSNGSSSNAVTEPKNLLEVVRNAAHASR